MERKKAQEDKLDGRSGTRNEFVEKTVGIFLRPTKMTWFVG